MGTECNMWQVCHSSARNPSTSLIYLFPVFQSPLNHLLYSFPIRNVLKKMYEFIQKLCTPKIPTCYSLRIPWEPFIPPHIDSWCFICLEYSFQLRELLLLHKILVYPIWEVYAPVVLGQTPWIDAVTETHLFPSETVCILVWSHRVGNVVKWLPSVSLFTLLAHKRGNRTCMCLLHPLLQLQHQAPSLP